MNPVRWFEIYVQDMNRAKKFYETVFTYKLERLETEHEMWAFPSKREDFGCSGALIKMTGVPSGGMGTIVYFASPDCAVEEKRVVSAGGRIEKPKFSIGPYGFITLAYDSEGNMFGIHSLQ